MTRNLQAIDVIIDKKQDELIALNHEKNDLRENMSDPRAICDNASKLEEKGREIAIFIEARDYILINEVDKIKDVFETLKQDCVDQIDNKKVLDMDTTEEEKNLNTLNSVINSPETNELNSSNPLNEQQNDNNDISEPDSGNFDE